MLERETDIESAIYDVVSEALYDPIEFSDVAELVGDGFPEYAEDERFIEEVYNRSGAVLKELFEQYSGSKIKNS